VLRRLRLLMGTTDAPAPTTVLVGPESAGKSSLAAALTGARARAVNVVGSTVAVERFTADDHTCIDTPGLVHGIDSEATRTTLAALRDTDDQQVLLVLRATHLDEELAQLLPLVAGRRGAVAVTHWDKVRDTASARVALDDVARQTGVPFTPVDARAAETTRRAVRAALERPGTFTRGPVLARVGWRVEPPPTLLEHPWLGAPAGLALLLSPAVLAVWVAVTLARVVEPRVEAALEPATAATGRLPWPVSDVVAGDYGLLTMGPLLVLWALPVVLVLALLLGLGKASGVLDRLTTAVHPLVRPFGLTGRDLVRVVAGYGCNVPAVIATRSCSSCSREATMGAIAFGSACSYQLAATLGVLAAAQRPGLAAPYLAVIVLGALVHARLLARRQEAHTARLDLSLLRGRAFLTRPRWGDVRREAATTLEHVTVRALPVFAAIVVGASVLAASGATETAAGLLEPLMAALRLPGDVALPVLLASIRKDGLLLLAEPRTVAALDDAQLLAALVLAGALLPCLVTAMTIARERSRRAATRLLVRQAAGALVLTAAISWAGLLVVRA
jgi:ferrous iron transport protein B